MNIKTLSFQQNESLSVVQFLTAQQNTFDYVSSSEAIKKGLIEVKEISESGSVNNLYVFNLSDRYVFFMDGDILAGAKQNRVLNTSILIAPNTKSTIPVSCVEAGRWNRRSDKFYDSDFISPTVLRAKKANTVKESLKSNHGFSSNQGQVWSDVDAYSTAYHIASPTKSLSDVFEEKKKDFDLFTSHFKADEKANGIALFVNKTILNIEVFNRTDVYSEYFPKILKAAAMEAFRIKLKDGALDDKEAFYKTTAFLDGADSIQKEIHNGVGVGQERRFGTKEMTGFELVYKENLIHFTSLKLG